MLEDPLQSILDEAHRQHIYVYDKDQYKVEEYWKESLVGDCEDFALYVRRQLYEQYLIQSDLIYCKNELGEGHLVVSVHGNILDNRHTYVTDKDNLPYEWISLGKPNGKWYNIIN